MKNGSDLIGKSGLEFFGRMSASISHELKNALAIIKENSGLLTDYLAMAARGMEVEPQRFQTVASRIEAQTVRADTIIKNLNQFAHTVDSMDKPVDLNEILTLLVALHNRPAAMQQVSLKPCFAEAPVVITTAPFLLLNALGLALNFALKGIAPDGTLSIAVLNSQTEVSLAFGKLEMPSGTDGPEYPQAQDNALLTAIGAEARMEKGNNQLIIAFPRL